MNANADFSKKIIAWQKSEGRHDLPWQNCFDPYRIWVSEIMLQQTQVSTVIPYFNRFMSVFPDIATLASSSLDAVLAHWSGLGYYSRARNLHLAAKEIMVVHGGYFPVSFELILGLPGIGRTTAAALSVFAYGAREAILDGNVKRVFARYFAIEGNLSGKREEKDLWPLAYSLLPSNEIAIYTQGLMDLGATCCKPRKPECMRCPLHRDCVAYRQGRVHEFPSKHLRKAIPEKQTVMLVLEHEGKLLFKRHPEKGLWGGLYVFPQAETIAEAENFVSTWLGMDTLMGRWLEPLMHTFTHFRLSILPWHIWVKDKVDPGRNEIWMTRSEALGAGLPVPVRKLVRQVIPD